MTRSIPSVVPPRRQPPGPRPGLPALLLASLLAGVFAACGGAARPGAVEVDPPATDTAGAVSLPSPGPLDSMPVPPSRPWLPLGVQWSPDSPREGEAVAIWLRQPRAGRRPASVEGTLDGRPVHFVRSGDDWFGMAAAPIGSAGPTELELRFHLQPDSVVRRSLTLQVGEREFPATSLEVDPRYSSPPPEAFIRIREERQLITAVLARATPRWLPRGEFRWPRDARITSPFGQRRLFNQELRSRHTGVDLDGPTGAPVQAAARGEVALTGGFYFAGNAVFLDHGLGVYTAYFHLSEIEVEEGETVEKGQVVGWVGATGRVTGPHLHWALYVNGESLDAQSLLTLDVPGGADGG